MTVKKADSTTKKVKPFNKKKVELILKTQGIVNYWLKRLEEVKNMDFSSDESSSSSDDDYNYYSEHQAAQAEKQKIIINFMHESIFV